MSLKIAVVGAGYWGPNIIRNFNQISSAEMAVCCDQDTNRLKHIKNLYPNINPVTDFDEVLKDPTIDAVAVCTHVSSHYPLAKKALEAGKHVLVEKPFTAKVSEAEELVELAAKSGTDYTVAYSNNTTAGTATVTVTGTGGYTGTSSATFAISRIFCW